MLMYCVTGALSGLSSFFFVYIDSLVLSSASADITV
jgi:hypothetical protein